MAQQHFPTPVIDVPGFPAFTAKDLAYCSTEEARAIVPHEVARRLSVLPISIVKRGSSKLLHLATVEVSPQIEKELKFLTESDIKLTRVDPSLIEEGITRAYCGSNDLLTREFQRLSALPNTQSKPQPPEVTASGDVATFLQTVLTFACARSASDVHLCPVSEGALVKLRIDGDLLIQDKQPYARHIHDQLVSRVKVLAKLDISKRTIPQDGSFVFRFQDSARPIRVSIMPTIHGESIVLRLLYARALPTLSKLSLPDRAVGLISAALKKGSGLILLTGPTGSGKTTTLYGAIREVVTRGQNVVTVEDPVEIPIPGVTQVQINTELGFDYPAAIRSVLRHDPDALLIGEIRDRDSAAIAFEAAMTGHLTLSSVHASSAAEVFERLEGLGISRTRASETIHLVLNQRLVPKLCDRCKVVDLNDSTQFKKTVHRAVGCHLCDYTGFDGRVILCEAISLLGAGAREIVRGSSSREEILSQLRSSDYLSWLVSLETHLSDGSIGVRQFKDFIDREMPVD